MRALPVQLRPEIVLRRTTVRIRGKKLFRHASPKKSLTVQEPTGPIKIGKWPVTDITYHHLVSDNKSHLTESVLDEQNFGDSLLAVGGPLLEVGGQPPVTTGAEGRP